MRCTLLTRWSMALAVGIIHWHDPSNKIHPQLKLKKTKVRLYVLVVSIAAKGDISVVHY